MHLCLSRGLQELEKLEWLKIWLLSFDTFDWIHLRLSMWRKETFILSSWLYQLEKWNHSSIVLVGWLKSSDPYWKYNLNHDGLVSTPRGGLLNWDGNRAGTKAFEKTKNDINMNLVQEEDEGNRVCDQLWKDFTWMLCPLIGIYHHHMPWDTDRLMHRHRQIEYYTGNYSFQRVRQAGSCTGCCNDTEDDEAETSLCQ